LECPCRSNAEKAARPFTQGAADDWHALQQLLALAHLAVLEDARLITVERRGRERWNYINAAPLRKIYERWLTPYQQLWASSLSQLGLLVEGDRQVQEQLTPAVRTASIVQETTIIGSPADVFNALTKKVAAWWSHVSYETDHKPDLQIEERVGGRFFEKCGSKQRLYATVTRLEPPLTLWMEGSMGLGGCVFGVVMFDLKERDDGTTTVRLTHRMMGEIDDDGVAMYRGGWKALLDEGLKGYVEHGTEAWGAA